MTISERLGNLRKRKGLKKTELARELGIPYSTYNHYEIGDREPNSDTLKLLSEYYDVTMDYILLGIEEKPKEIEELTKEEKELLQLYRGATEKAKGMAVGVLMSNQHENNDCLKKNA